MVDKITAILNSRASGPKANSVVESPATINDQAQTNTTGQYSLSLKPEVQEEIENKINNTEAWMSLGAKTSEL